MIVVPYQAEHMARIQLQSTQLCNLNWMAEDQAELLENHVCFTVLDGEEVLLVGGVLRLWEGRATAWAFLSKKIGHRFVKLHRLVKRYFDTLDYGRIEAEVAFDFPEGHRWIRLLGFELENARMRKFFPDGTDAALYVRIR
jgi:hypothetical protein